MSNEKSLGGGGGEPGLIFAGYGLSELLPRYSLFCGQL